LINWRYASQALLLAAVGCSSGSPPSPSVTEPPKLPPTTPVARRPSLPDKSLSTDEYIRLGMPNPDHVWSSHEMNEAAICLRKLTARGYERMPRYQSDRSGDVFSRITSVDNYARFRDKKLPMAGRLPEVGTYSQALSEIYQTYLNAFAKYGTLDAEAVEMMGICLRSSVAMSEVADEFLATLDRTDGKYPVRLAGLERMKKGFAEVMLGALMMIGELPDEQRQARDRLAAYLVETCPPLVSGMPKDSKGAIMAKLQTMAKSPPAPELRDTFEGLLATINRTAEPPDHRD
jgi:hypothetical protein